MLVDWFSWCLTEKRKWEKPMPSQHLPRVFCHARRCRDKETRHKLLKNDSKVKQVRVCTNLFWKLIFTSVLTARMEDVLMTAMMPHCGRTFLPWAALPCISVLPCLHEGKIFRGSLIMSFVPLWWAPPQSQASRTWDLVLGSALPSTFQCFLPETHQPLSAAGSHAVSSLSSSCFGAVANQTVVI